MMRNLVPPPALCTLLLLLVHAAMVVLSAQLQAAHEPLKEQGWGSRGAGSRLPDCTRACEGCAPCKRVVISFKCSLAEPCPIVYRCSCHGRFYHVPSSD